MSEECLGNGASGGNVIYYMKLLHELKANYPSVPDEIVKESVIKFRGDKDRCSRDLSVIAGSIRPKRHALEEGKFGGPYRGKSKRGDVGSKSSHFQHLSSSPAPNTSVSSSSSLAPPQPRCTRFCREPNPYSKVFARRKSFYQRFSEISEQEVEDARFFSSANLVWRRRRCSLCSDEDSKKQKKALPNRRSDDDEEEEEYSRFITLNANITPFAPFVITHDSEGSSPGALSLLGPLEGLHASSGHSSSIGGSTGNNSDKMELRSLDGGRFHYATINSCDGGQSRLEVALGTTESFITATHHQKSSPPSPSSSVFHLQYGKGGRVLNITSSFLTPKEEPQLSLLLGGGCPPPAVVSSAYNTRTALLLDPPPSPRYNSLPNLSSSKHGLLSPSRHVSSSLDHYVSNPADEEKRMAYTRALLTHQMEQYLKLGQELGIERSKLNCLREEISRIEERRNKRRLIKLNAQIKLNEGLEKDIKSLRFSCDTLAAKVTKITKGKIPLGETNIELYARLGPSKNAESNNNKNPSSGSSSPFVMRECKEPFNNLSHFIKALDEDKAAASKALLPPPSSSSSSRCSRPLEQWACTECTFLNHPALNDCEECEMPRFSSGLSSQEEDGSSRAFIHP